LVLLLADDAALLPINFPTRLNFDAHKDWFIFL
jgi:hypothetical protein